MRKISLSSIFPHSHRLSSLTQLLFCLSRLKHGPHQRVLIVFNCFFLYIYWSTGISEKIVFFSQFTATHPSPTSLQVFSKLSTQCECIVIPIGW